MFFSASYHLYKNNKKFRRDLCKIPAHAISDAAISKKATAKRPVGAGKASNKNKNLKKDDNDGKTNKKVKKN